MIPNESKSESKKEKRRNRAKNQFTSIFYQYWNEMHNTKNSLFEIRKSKKIANSKAKEQSFRFCSYKNNTQSPRRAHQIKGRAARGLVPRAIESVVRCRTRLEIICLRKKIFFFLGSVYSFGLFVRLNYWIFTHIVGPSSMHIGPNRKTEQENGGKGKNENGQRGEQ